MNPEYKKIVLVRAECSNKNMGKLLQKIRGARQSFQNNECPEDASILIREYMIPANGGASNIETIYNGLLKKESAPQDYFEREKVDFSEYNGRGYYIFDLVYSENSHPDKFENMQDTVFLQYLLLVLNRLAASRIGFSVFLSAATGSLNDPHSPLSYDDSVSKMRTYLSLCAQTGAIFQEYSPLLERIRVFYQYNGSERKWMLLFADARDDSIEIIEGEPLGRIIPFIPINRETYYALQDTMKAIDPEKNGIEVQLFRLYNNYLERYIRLLPAFQKLQTIKSDGTQKRLPPQINLDMKECEILSQIRKALNDGESDIYARISIVISNGLQLANLEQFIASVQKTIWEAFTFQLLGVKKPVSAKQLTAYLISQKQLSKKERSKQGETIQTIAHLCTNLVDELFTVYHKKIHSIVEKLKKCIDQLQDVIQSDIILERLLFMATLCYLEESEIEKAKEAAKNEKIKKSTKDLPPIEKAETMRQHYWGHFSREDISLLHEYCVDYAQGIFQLVENAWFHVIKSNNSGPTNRSRGCGGLTIRVRKKEDIKNFLNEKKTSANNEEKTAFKSIPYFLEIYVTDLQYTYDKASERSFSNRSVKPMADRPFESIVKVFCDNIKKRAKEETQEAKEACVAARKFIQDNIEGIELNPFLASDVPFYTKRITLRQMFGAEESESLTAYLQNEANIAYHYGLQILSNVVETGNGYMMVKSGEGKTNYYSSDSDNFLPQLFNWTDGTAYVLFLPISLKKHTNYQDTLAVPVLNSTEAKRVEKYQIVFRRPESFNRAGDSPQRKNEIVEQVMELFRKEIVSKEPNSVFILDCSEFQNGLDYEIIAKAVFRCIAHEKECSPSFALLNVKNRHEVVKLFRQFALFYNRQGECPVISDSSAIFIVDQRAELDILLRGSIKTINESLYYSQIYGGLDSRAMQIMEHLGSRGNRNG